MPAFMQVKERIPAAAAAQRCEPQGFMHRMRFTYEEKRWLRITIFVVIAAVCAAFFYAFNLQTALIADDYNYRFIFGAADQRVEHIFDIIESMRAHYHTMNGRLILHSLTQLFLLWGKPVFNVVNTVGYLLFTGLIYWHCKGTGRHSPALYFGVHLMVWFFIPVYGQTMLWVDGSANYMWGSILRLAALLPLRLHVQAARPAAGSWWWLLLSIPAGVIAGWTNENSGAAFLVIVGLFLLYNRANKGRIPRWAVGMLAGAAVGFAVMSAAPGNHVRLENNLGVPVTAFQRLWNGITVCNRKLFYYLLPVFALYAVCLALLHFFGPEGKREKRRRMLLSGIYLIGALAGVYAMLFVPYFPARATFGSVACAIVATGTLYAGIRLDQTAPRVIQTLVFVSCMVGAAVMYGETYLDNAQAYRQIQEREAYIEQEKAAGRFDVALRDVRVKKNMYSPYYGLADVEPNPQHWANTSKARYYGLHSITLKKP